MVLCSMTGITDLITGTKITFILKNDKEFSEKSLKDLRK
jgi:hypothetical protein